MDEAETRSKVEKDLFCRSCYLLNSAADAGMLDAGVMILARGVTNIDVMFRLLDLCLGCLFACM